MKSFPKYPEKVFARRKNINERYHPFHSSLIRKIGYYGDCTVTVSSFRIKEGGTMNYFLFQKKRVSFHPNGE